MQELCTVYPKQVTCVHAKLVESQAGFVPTFEFQNGFPPDEDTHPYGLQTAKVGILCSSSSEHIVDSCTL